MYPKSFPKDMPEWQAIQDEFNAKQDTKSYLDSPLMVPEDAIVKPQAPIQSVPNNPMQDNIADDEAALMPTVLGQGIPTGEDYQANFDKTMAGIPDQDPPAPKMDPREALLEEFRRMRQSDEQALKEARDSDRMLALGGAVGDSLATILNARSQMNVKAPGVKVQQGAGLSNTLKNFQTAGQVGDDIKQRREDLLAQYKILSDQQGGLNPYQLKSLELKEKSLRLAELQEMGRSGRATENLSLRERMFEDKVKEQNELKSKESENILAADIALDSLDRLDGLKEFSTGPITARKQKILSFIGMGEGNKAKLAAQLGVVLSAYGKQISGTAVGEEEFKRLQLQLPQMSDNDEEYAAKLANFKTQLENSRQRMVTHYEKVGRNVDNFKQRETIEAKENDPRIDSFMKKNNIKDRNEAIKILKENGMI